MWLYREGPNIQTIEEDGVITVIHTPASTVNENNIVQYIPVSTPGAVGHETQEGMTEEVVETHVTIPYEINGEGQQPTETNSAVSTIQFEAADGETAQATAANLAALYSGETTHITMPSDSIIYQGDENGEEVVYVVIPEDNQTVILSWGHKRHCKDTAKCLRQSDESDGGSWIVDYPTCNLSRYTSLRLVEFEEDIVLY